MPPVNTLLVMPPPADPVFGFNIQPASSVVITGWPPTGPLTDSVNFRLLNLHGGEYLGQHPWLQAIVTGSGGALMLAGERSGHRIVALGFNPFPYLGRQNLPMSVLTLNSLSYLAGFGAETAGYHTGDPWIVPAGVDAIVPPNGHKIKVTPGMLFTGANFQGLYRAHRLGRGQIDPRGQPRQPARLRSRKHALDENRSERLGRDGRGRTAPRTDHRRLHPGDRRAGDP